MKGKVTRTKVAIATVVSMGALVAMLGPAGLIIPNGPSHSAGVIVPNGPHSNGTATLASGVIVQGPSR